MSKSLNRVQIVSSVGKKFKSIAPRDLYVPGDRFYRVVGVYLGAEGQESMVGLRPLDRSYGVVGQGSVDEMMVPLDMIVPQCVYRMVDHDAEADA